MERLGESGRDGIFFRPLKRAPVPKGASLTPGLRLGLPSAARFAGFDPG
jgi:hypothetical protein